jgi:hypothetical protein
MFLQNMSKKGKRFDINSMVNGRHRGKDMYGLLGIGDCTKYGKEKIMVDKIFFITGDISKAPLIEMTDNYGVKVHITRQQSTKWQIILSGTAFMVSVSELSENAPVWLAPIEKVSFPLPEFLRNTTVDEDVAAVVTRHHNLDIVPAGNGICCVDSEEAAYEEFEPSKHPLKVKKD